LFALASVPPSPSLLSLHDALPIWYVAIIAVGAWAHPRYVLPGLALLIAAATPAARALCGRWVFCLVVAVTVGGNLLLVSRMLRRSEDHTSQLQSLTNLLCRLLPAK